MADPNLPGIRRVNLRNLEPARFDAAELIIALDEAQVIRVVWPNAGGEVIKGRELLQRIVNAGQGQALKFLEFEIANTTQAELLAAALMNLARGGRQAIDRDVLQNMLVAASTIRAGPDDFERFQKRLRDSAH
jgi:hypothetical protein